MLGAPALRPARSSKVLLAKKFQTQSSGHPFGEGWVSGTPPSLGDTLERLQFVPIRPQTLSRRIIPEFAVPVAPDPVFFRELSGSPTFP
jgi:hypothetical protein